MLFGGALFLWMLRSQSKYPDMLLLWLHSNFDGMKMCTSGHGFTGGWGGIQKNLLSTMLNYPGCSLETYTLLKRQYQRM